MKVYAEPFSVAATELRPAICMERIWAADVLPGVHVLLGCHYGDGKVRRAWAAPPATPAATNLTVVQGGGATP